jgi:hypothetical protein
MIIGFVQAQANKDLVSDLFLLLRNFWGHLQHRSDHPSLPYSYSGDSDLLQQPRQAPNATSAHVGTTLQAAGRTAVELYPN